MACQPWRNKPDDAKRKADIIAALKASRTRDEAARPADLRFPYDALEEPACER